MKTILLFFCVAAVVTFVVGHTLATGDDGSVAARTAALRGTLADIDAELHAHGHTWEEWARSLKAYRDDIREIIKRQPPWPAHGEYKFQGAEMAVHLSDGFAALPEGERPLDSLLHFHRQLRALGIDLIVAIIPAKLTVYPDYIYVPVDGGTNRPARAPGDRNVSIAVKRLMKDLVENEVEVIDLHKAFAEFRRTNGEDAPLFYGRDAHYMNRAARLCADKVSERLKRYDFVQSALKTANPYTAGKGARDDGTKADGDLRIIKDTRNGQSYTDVPDSFVLVCGDSHLLHNDDRGASLTAQIAYRIGMPVSRIAREALSGTIPIEVCRDGNLRKRRVVVAHFTERMLKPGRSQWPLVDLSLAGVRTGGTPEDSTNSIFATGTIRMTSERPNAESRYQHFIMKFYMDGLTDEQGKPLVPSDGVVTILAMKNRKILSSAGLGVGRQIRIRLTPWYSVERLYARIQSGTLPDVALELDKRTYWGQIPDQPSLAREELSRVGEEAAPP